jgi:hypothetical protein
MMSPAEKAYRACAWTAAVQLTAVTLFGAKLWLLHLRSGFISMLSAVGGVPGAGHFAARSVNK